jgi:hypothetical protein
VSTPSGEISKVWTGRPASSHGAKFRRRCQAARGDQFQPQYRMSFALESGLKDGPFPGILQSLVSVDSLVNFSIRCKLRQHRDLRIQKGNEGSNPSCSARQSEQQRLAAYVRCGVREMRPYFAILARQTGPQRMDCLGSGWQPSALFSEAAMSSPTPARC